jgi:DNA-binding response OmpR family regulator
MKPLLIIADDDAELLALSQRFLSARGYNVETTSDGLDCLEKLRRLAPEVLVLDLELRWGGGDGLLARLREESTRPWIPVVLTATAGYPQDLAAFIEPPVVDYLPKPFALTALLDRVRSAVATTRRGQPSRWNQEAACPELFIG